MVPFQTPVYRASASLVVAVACEKTRCWTPSGATATWGAPTLCATKCRGIGADGCAPAAGGGASGTRGVPPPPIEAALLLSTTERLLRMVMTSLAHGLPPTPAVSNG